MPDCEHPTEEVQRNRNGKIQTEHQRQCYCWGGMGKTRRIFTALESRGFIVVQGEGWVLTGKGWHYLNREKRAPVKVVAWEANGNPRTYEIRKSQRAEFQPLYAKEQEAT